MDFHEQVSDATYAMNQIIEAAQSIIKHSKNPNQIKKLEELATRASKLESTIKIEEEARKMINNNYSKNYIENLNYAGMIKEYVDQNQKSLDFKQTPSYKRFDKIISAVPRKDDDDIVELNITKSLVCPILKIRLEDPMKNTPCGHTYSKSAIEEMLRGKRSIQCPVSGCKYEVSRQTLVRDTEMEELLASNP